MERTIERNKGREGEKEMLKGGNVKTKTFLVSLSKHTHTTTTPTHAHTHKHTLRACKTTTPHTHTHTHARAYTHTHTHTHTHTNTRMHRNVVSVNYLEPPTDTCIYLTVVQVYTNRNMHTDRKSVV